MPANGQVVVDVFADIGNSPNVTVTNTNSPTITPVVTQANVSAGTAASSSVFTYAAGGTASITVNGHLVTAVAATDTATSVANIVNALNSDATITSGWVVSSTGGTTVVLTRRSSGTAGNFSVVTSTTSGTFVTAVSPTVNGTAGTAQIETYTVGADIVAGNVYSITLNSIASTYTAVTGDTATTVGDGLRTAINANVTTVTATGTTTVIVTANTAGTAFTVGASTAVVGSHTTGGAVATKLSLTATGTVSNSTVSSSPTSQLGQTVTTTAGVLTPSAAVTTSSPAAQFVIGGSSPVLATYHFVATNGAATIDELTFKITTSGSSAAPIGTVTVNGISSAPTYTTINACTSDGTHMCVDLNGLNIVVPVGSAGIDVPVTVTFNNVGTGNQVSGRTAVLTLYDVYSHFGSTNVHTSNVNPYSKTMTAVASKPTVVMVPLSGVVLQGTSAVEAYDLKVTADAAGPITINSFDITSTLTASGATFTASAPTVQDVAGASIDTTGTPSCDGSITCASNVILNGGYALAAGQSQTFRVFLPVNSIGTTVSSPNNAMNTKINTSGTVSGFSWTDTAGAGTATTGTTNIYAFPTSSQNVHN